MNVYDIACLTAQCITIRGDNLSSEEFIRFSFNESVTEFGVDSYSTANVYNNVSLFIPESLI